jgi:two-component system, NtrC family, response regulator
MKKGNILVIDDENKLRGLMARLINAEGFDVWEAQDGKTGLKKLENLDIDAVLCDVKLPDTNGIALTEKIKCLYPYVELVIVTAYGNIPDGVKAIKAGAFDYLTKGDDNERIIPLLSRAVEKAQLQKRVRYLEKQVSKKFGFDTIIGSSKAITEALSLAKRVAPNNTNVLLTGETGTGKEVFAAAIHQASPRANKSFVALNCSAFSKDLIESELFGHAQGAYTGAIRDKKGLVEEAQDGTLFLDEIGEMPLELQAKLLRLLETNEFMRVGETKVRKSDFRLIAATNKDLKLESEEKRFRADLYFRLNVFEIHLPPLRERVKDIEPFTRFFVKYFCEKINRKPLSVSPDFINLMEQYAWTGNIRELRNMIERCVILANEDTLTASLLPADLIIAADLPGKTTAFSMAQVEKQHIQKVLHYTHGNKAEAARLLEIGIATLYRKLEEFNIH